MTMQSLSPWLDSLDFGPMPNLPQAQARDQSAATQHAHIASADTFWNPTPSAPDFLCDDLTEMLTQELASRPFREQPARSTSEDSKGDCVTDNNLELGQAQQKVRDGNDQLSQRKLEVNRAAQRRFRARQKDRARQVEAELARTKAELHKLQAQQEQQNSRTLLLEKLAKLNSPQGADTYIDQAQDEGAALATREIAASSGQGIHVTLPGQEHTITVQELRTISLSKFAALWTEYIRELGRLLVCLDGAHDMATENRMQQLARESNQLLGCIKALNPAVYKSVLTGRLDDGQQVTSAHLPDSFYDPDQVLWESTDAQYQDLLYLRSLYLTKRASLAIERNSLTKMHTNCASSVSRDGLFVDGLFSGLNLSQMLRQNAVDDYSAYVKVAFAVRRGVFRLEQWVTMVVHAYPFFPRLETWFERVALHFGAPSKQDYVAIAQKDPKTAEWAALDDYIAKLLSHPTNEHEPVPRVKKEPKSAPAQPNEFFDLNQTLWRPQQQLQQPSINLLDMLL